MQNLRNDIIVPKHNLKIKTIVIQRLAIDIDLAKWLEAISDCLLFQDMIISISFRNRGLNIFLLKSLFQIKPQISFLAKNEANQLVYMNGSDPWFKFQKQLNEPLKDTLRKL